MLRSSMQFHVSRANQPAVVHLRPGHLPFREAVGAIPGRACSPRSAGLSDEL